MGAGNDGGSQAGDAGFENNISKHADAAEGRGDGEGCRKWVVSETLPPFDQI